MWPHATAAGVATAGTTAVDASRRSRLIVTRDAAENFQFSPLLAKKKKYFF
jgi:hypothetical protein